MPGSPEAPDFRAFQAAFAARIRDPRGQPRPRGVPAKRMRVYEELLFDNLEGFLLACFPITRQLLGARVWRRTLRRFFAEHRCRSPLFRDIPGEFLMWIEPLAGELFPRHPYLYEFMHYEWVELAVSVDDARREADVVPQGDLLEEIPVLDPVARLVRYRYPVHRIGPRFRLRPSDVQDYAFLVYRDGEDRVRFLLLNPVSARLLELLGGAAMSGGAAIARIDEELRHPDSVTLRMAGLALLERLRDLGVVLGTRRRP